MPCSRALAEGQWWSYCGETDMGQTAPALCVDCGGPFKLKEPALPRVGTQRAGTQHDDLQALLAALDKFLTSKRLDHTSLNYAELADAYEKYKKGKP